MNSRGRPGAFRLGVRSLAVPSFFDNKTCCFLLSVLGWRHEPGKEPGQMNVSLTPELEQFVNGKVQIGMYRTATEVVREGLRLLKEREEIHHQKLSDVRQAVQVGIHQADRGEGIPIDEAWAEGVKKGGRERL